MSRKERKQKKAERKERTEQKKGLEIIIRKKVGFEGNKSGIKIKTKEL